MLRLLRNTLVALALAAIAVAGVLLWASPDPLYTAQEWAALGRYSARDELIRERSAQRNVDPLLVKAIVWRESGFDPTKVGTKGERGLMQITEAAAADWAKANKIEAFVGTDLFDPRTNLDAGAWYFRRALDRWKAKDDPIPFALAEYNAGASRVDRWVAESGMGEKADAADFMAAIDFPTTRRYIEDIVARYHFYRKRDEK